MNKNLGRTRMEEKLGRPLLKNEKVFHLSGDENDNRPENLILESELKEWAVKEYLSRGIVERQLLSAERELKELSLKPLPMFEKEEKNDEEPKQEQVDCIKICNELKDMGIFPK